ncbi:MAG: phosphotransferase [Anaerolineales bacterium]|nr:phosphotransferase [Anaerolineales bacterium]
MALSLAQAIARVPSWVGKDAHATPLGGGITNRNYRVDVAGESFVLRICGEATELVGVNRDAEYAANYAAGQLGIAPPVFYRILPESYLVTRFIHGEPIPPDAMGKPENIRRVAQAIKQFHALPLTLPTTFSPFRRVEQMAKIARERGARFPKNFDWFVAQMRKVERAFLRDPFVPRPCHDDLLNANFLDDGRLYILDWEFAGMGDVFFDLANFASHHRFDDAQVRVLLQAYFGDFTAQQFARLQLMRAMSEIHEAMLGVAQSCISKLDFDFNAYADLWFGRAAQFIQNPEWEKWLKETTNA